MKTRKTKPIGPEDSLGAYEQLRWLVLDVETGGVVGKITKMNTASLWRAYVIEEVPYGEPPKEPIRLGGRTACQDAQRAIEDWHTEKADRERTEALRDIREGR